jgi:hypothetical protein
MTIYHPAQGAKLKPLYVITAFAPNVFTFKFAVTQKIVLET